MRQTHRWELPVLRYHRIRVNYLYPLLGVNFGVLLLYFIRKNYRTNQSNSKPFPLIMVNYPILSLNEHILCFHKNVQNILFPPTKPEIFIKNG